MYVCARTHGDVCDDVCVFVGGVVVGGEVGKLI